MTLELVHADAFAWMRERVALSIHAVVTDPPFAVKDFAAESLGKLRAGAGGMWRQPPKLDGSQRRPVPRFTVLSPADIRQLEAFYTNFGELVHRILVPGAHVLVACSPLFSQHVCTAMLQAGFEKRGEIVRLVQTLRGGDRPKGAHREFADVTVMPRSRFEPWCLFRKPCEGRVQDTLRRWGTGGLRRPSADQPFCDVIRSAPTRPRERALSPHPALKPQAFMRQIVRAALPLGRGTILDPFMGGGSTVAAAAALGHDCIGIERDATFFAMALEGIPRLQALA